MNAAKAVGRGDPQVAADNLLAVGQCLGQRLHRIGHDGAVRCDQGALVGQADLAAGSLDEPEADALFQRTQALGHGGRRHVQFSGAFGEGRGAGQHVEEAKVVRADH